MANRFSVIVAESINETQRMQLQAAVEERAASWWHQMRDVWIVESSLPPKEWMAVLAVIFPHMPAQLLVLALPPKDAVGYSSKMPLESAQWLIDHFGGTVQGEEKLDQKSDAPALPPSSG